MISQVMGHKDLETTNTYLDSFGDAEIERVTIGALYKNRAWISECRHKLKDNGTIWISGTYHNIFLSPTF